MRKNEILRALNSLNYFPEKSFEKGVDNRQTICYNNKALKKGWSEKAPQTFIGGNKNVHFYG